MIRNLMKTLLCLVLALALPLCALADTQHTLTIVPGEEVIGGDQMVKDIFDALSFKLTTGETSGALTFALSDTDIATIALKADANGLFAQSDVIGEDVYYVAWDDMFALLEQTIQSSLVEQAKQSGTDVDEEAVAMIGTVMEQYKTQLKTALNAGSLTELAQPKDPDAALAMVSEMFKDDPAMVEYIKGIMDRMVIEEGDFTAPERDAATQKYSMTMTNQDFIAICDTQYMRSMLEQAEKADNADATEEELKAEVDETIAEVKKLYQDSNINVTMNCYTADEGNTLVGMDMSMLMDIKDEDDTAKTDMTMNYNRLTGESGVSHKAGLVMTVDDAHLCEMSFDLNKNTETGVSEGMAAMWADSTQISVLYKGENTETGRVRSFALYGRDGATTIIEPAASERTMMTFVIDSTADDGARLAAIEAATAETAVNVLKLSAEELQAIGTQVTGRAMMLYGTIMQNLPASVQQMLMEQMMQQQQQPAEETVEAPAE